MRPSPVKIGIDHLHFWKGDICRSTHPPCGLFRYYIILMDASTSWSHVCLLSTCNLTFARLLAQIIKLRAHFPDYCIKTIHPDNAGDFIYQCLMITVCQLE